MGSKPEDLQTNKLQFVSFREKKLEILLQSSIKKKPPKKLRFEGFKLLTFKSFLPMKHFISFLSFMFIALVASIIVSCTKDDLIKETINFQNVLLSPNSYWNGSDGSGPIKIGSATFNNLYIDNWDYWEGFSLSNMVDITSPGWSNQYSAYLVNGGDIFNIYSISYVNDESSTISFKHNVNLISAKITNSTYTYFSILNGNEYAKKFEEGDWFKLTIVGFDHQEEEKEREEFYLADFRLPNSYIVDNWTKISLKNIKGVRKIIFYLDSTDEGDWGMNTPAYFCLDDLVFEYME